MEHDHVHHILEQWRSEVPELDRSAFAIVGRISRLAELLQAEIEAGFAAHGITGGEFDVLAALRRAGEPYRLTPTELSAALLVSTGGMTKRLVSLERRHLIRREADPEDGRSRLVVLTREGRLLVDAILVEHVANEDSLLDGLTAEERTALAALLERLAVSLGDAPDARPRPISRLLRGASATRVRPPRGPGAARRG
jgi:DNA-binding MarR family transcriptional regulator